LPLGWTFVHDEKLSFKKSVVAGEHGRSDVERRRAQWIKRQQCIDPSCLVFINKSVLQRHGRSGQYTAKRVLLWLHVCGQLHGAEVDAGNDQKLEHSATDAGDAD
jgi:hypothetical protein